MPVRSFGALGAGVCICLCAPVVCAQVPPDATSAETRARVSVRELSIPASARRSYAKGHAAMLDKGQAAAAVKHLRKAIAQYPDYYEAYYLLGVAHITLQKPALAEAALRQSISLSPERFAQPLVALASLYSTQSRFAEAEPLAAQAVALDDTLWYAHYELGRARFKLGSFAQALPSARLVVREQPGYANGRLLLALVEAQLQHYDEALPHLDVYLRLTPRASDHARITRLRAQIATAAGLMHTAAAASNPD